MILITFSGIDGCGKSTHVARTCDGLRAQGLRVRRLVTLRYSVTGVFLMFRERWRRMGVGEKDASGARSTLVPASVPDLEYPSRPRIQTYRGGRTFDQDRRSRLVRFRRMLTYPLDCMALRAVIETWRLTGIEAVVCDRYVYDKIVCLPRMDGWLARLLRWIMPKVDYAFILDAAPQHAANRKLEHQADYYQTKARDYRRLAEINGELQIIESTSIESVQRQIDDAIESSLSASPATA